MRAARAARKSSDRPMEIYYGPGKEALETCSVE